MVHGVGEVKVTTKYDLFEFKRGNRPIRARVKHPQAWMAEKNLLPAYPILCAPSPSKKGHFEILDGQNRFTAAKALGLPINYTVDGDGIGIAEIARINSNQRAWTLSDYLNAYAEDGRRDYVRLAHFVKETKLPISVAIHLCAGHMPTEGGRTGKTRPLNARFYDGDYRVGDMAFASRVAKLVNDMLPIVSFAKDRNVVGALSRCLLVPAFSERQFLQKLKYMSSQFVKCAGLDQYIQLISEIYNYRVPPKRLLPLAIEIRKLMDERNPRIRNEKKAAA